MVDITHKINSLRTAVAIAKLTVSKKETIEAIQKRTVPKGDVFEFGRAAGLLAVKKTSDLIPDCHPLPIEKAIINYSILELTILIRVEVQTIYKTGVEVEAMHGASVVALTLYDMLKPIDKNLEISSIKLEEKKGGKSDFLKVTGLDIKDKAFKSAVVVCSDSISLGTKKDTAGKEVIHILEASYITVSQYTIIPDEKDIIRQKAIDLSNEGFNLVLFVGGTGLSSRDVTPEAIAPILDRTIPGMMEAARSYGQNKTPYAMLSRGIAGFLKETLIITLPGSTKGARESMEAIFPYFLHLFKVVNGFNHDSFQF